MKTLKALLMISTTLCLLSITAFFVQASRTTNQVTLMATDSRTMMADIQKRVDYTSQDLNAILIQAGIVASRMEEASRSSTQVSKKTLDILSHTDQVLTQVTQSTQDISSHTVQALDALPPVLNELHTTAQTMNKTIGDPNITKSLENIQQVTAQTAVTMNNVAASTQDVKDVADHYKAQLTKPVSFMKKLGGYVVTGLKVFVLFK